MAERQPSTAMTERQSSTSSSNGRPSIARLIRQAVPPNPDRQTRINHIPAEYAQDTIDEAWKVRANSSSCLVNAHSICMWQMLDNTGAAPRIHSELTLYSQTTLLRRLCLKLSVAHDVLPRSFYLSGVVCISEEATDSGTYSDIYKGRYRNLRVVLKRPRLSSENHSDSYKKVCCVYYSY